MTIRHFVWPLAAGLFSTCVWAQQYTISTIAGNGTAGYSGDGGAPTSAQLSSPDGIAFDSSGNMYIADSANQRIREISGGAINTIAGNGTAGYSGDVATGVTGTATDAELRGPSGVAVDSSGNIYIADTGNHVIRVVTNGIISTIAGDNTGGYMGDGGAAVDAELDLPTSVAVDASGNIYIADSGNNVIREITASNGYINTILGDGITTTVLNNPVSIALDGKGNLYVCDSNGLRVLKFSLSTSTVTLVAGNGNIGFSGDFGPAVDAELDDPSAIAIDSSGNLYIADTNNSRIRKVYPDGTIVTIAGSIPGYGGNGGPASKATLAFPHGLAFNGSSGNLYLADSDNQVIRLLKPVTPSITAGGVVNAASFTDHVSPGALASIFGSNFMGSESGTASLPLPAGLAGISVSVNGRAAPLLYLSTDQINFQIPWETAAGSATLTVSSGGIQSAGVKVSVLAAAPGLFFQGSHAIVQNSNYSLNSLSDPAQVGSTIIAYLTGAGAVSPVVADGEPAASSPPSTVTSNVTATIGSQTAQVSFAGLAPDFVGLWQVNVVVPAGLTKAGDYPLIISVDGQGSNAANVSVTP
jgi:uncharacterized protein (TIGR03437 family)